MANENNLTLEDKQGRRQINQYDKVLRENMEAVLPGLIKNLLHIDTVETEELPDDIQHTKERKPDVLKKVRDKNNATFVFHIELQVKDESDMVLRMAEYFIMLYRRYRLPVRQMKNIVNQVVAASGGDFSRQRHLRQLLILSQLRKFTQENLAIMDNLTGFFTKEKDPLYRLGEREGIEKGIGQGEEKKSYEVVTNLLLANQFTITEIAQLANVPESFVEKVKKTLN